MNILSIQSHVVYGHVGNSAAAFPLQVLGHEVWPIHTVQFSNHAAYPSCRGEMFAPDKIREVFEGLAERNVLSSCDAVLSGYLGNPGTGEEVLRMVRRVKEANPKAVYCCDPVMGDRDGGLFAAKGIPDFFRDRALGAADIITPNHFELEYLAGRELRDLDSVLDACTELHAGGPGMILVTSFEQRETEGEISILVSSAESAWQAATPKLELETRPHGSGDLATALFLGHYLNHKDATISLQRTAGALHDVFVATKKSGSTELCLVDSCEHFRDPTRRFALYKCR